jgi:hypothetical protein
MPEKQIAAFQVFVKNKEDDEIPIMEEILKNGKIIATK